MDPSAPPLPRSTRPKAVDRSTHVSAAESTALARFQGLSEGLTERLVKRGSGFENPPSA